ncbi:class II fructose-bisphosphate aldolase [Patescibacteria group bacterium]|nr:class II fructose-bisphosphate aldolase [Patescibacteria group bacterium]
MLVHIKKIIRKAQQFGYAVPAFNVNNLETIIAVLRAAEKMKSPVILQATESAIAYAGLEELSALMRAAAGEVNVPVAIHLDHGHDLKIIKQAIAQDFFSVMIDGSACPYKKNVLLTKKVVRFAHEKKVWVQGEIGRLEGAEDWVKTGKLEAFFTEPEDAVRFVQDTGVDALAVAIGNYHGVEKIIEKKELKLDLKRLAEIATVVRAPLVLHGASGFPAGQIKKAIKSGIRIINIDSELRISFAKAQMEFWRKNNKIFDPRKILKPSILKMQKTAEEKIKIFGCKGKA